MYYESLGLANYETNTPFSNRTAFKVGEVCELIVSDIVDGMVQKNKFHLSDKVSRYLPEISAHYTVNDLLNHQTNLPN